VGDHEQVLVLSARFERNLLWLYTDVESEAGIPLRPRHPQPAVSPPGAPSASSCRPIRSGLIRIDTFEKDIDATLRLATAAHLGGDERVYLFVKRGSLRGKVHAVSDAMMALLERCDGTRTVADVVSQVAGDVGASERVVSDALRKLVDERIVFL
jgi:hypothetical protein